MSPILKSSLPILSFPAQCALSIVLILKLMTHFTPTPSLALPTHKTTSWEGMAHHIAFVGGHDATLPLHREKCYVAVRTGPLGIKWAPPLNVTTQSSHVPRSRLTTLKGGGNFICQSLAHVDHAPSAQSSSDINFFRGNRKMLFL